MVCTAYAILQLYKKLRIPRARSTAIQFILSNKPQNYIFVSENQNTNLAFVVY